MTAELKKVGAGMSQRDGPDLQHCPQLGRL